MDNRFSSINNSNSENRHYKRYISSSFYLSAHIKKNRIKLDTAQIETNDDATENINNSAVKTQAAFVNKLYK